MCTHSNINILRSLRSVHYYWREILPCCDFYVVTRSYSCRLFLCTLAFYIHLSHTHTLTFDYFCILFVVMCMCTVLFWQSRRGLYMERVLNIWNQIVSHGASLFCGIQHLRDQPSYVVRFMALIWLVGLGWSIDNRQFCLYYLWLELRDPGSIKPWTNDRRGCSIWVTSLNLLRIHVQLGVLLFSCVHVFYVQLQAMGHQLYCRLLLPGGRGGV